MSDSKRVVVFVCTFNLCRSVSAQYFLGKFLLERGKKLSDSIEVTSRGIVSKEMSALLKEKGIPEPGFGQSCRRQILDIAAKHGIDVSEHKSKRLSGELAARADLIITMESFQKKEVLALYPDNDRKVFTFREFFEISGPTIVEDSFSLPQFDPLTDEYGYPYEYDDQTMEAIKGFLSQGVEKILRFLKVA